MPNSVKILFPINFNDFQFRVNYKTERDLTPENADMIKPEILQLFDSWRDNRKIFRFIKRYTFQHENTNKYPFKFDLSVVKTNKQTIVRYYIIYLFKQTVSKISEELYSQFNLNFVNACLFTII